MRQGLGWLLSAPDVPRKWWRVIAWWELRRIPYNVMVGVVGVLSLVVLNSLLTSLGEQQPGDALENWLVFGVAAVSANIAYTLGWALELAIMLGEKRDPALGSSFFKLGLVFSLLVVTVPTTLAGALWIVKLIVR